MTNTNTVVFFFFLVIQGLLFQHHVRYVYYKGQRDTQPCSGHLDYSSHNTTASGRL
uniref:Uncharacterized protein n=1 Tax=Anguilla anguilla TaxID=7936 RepID=A0A0E9Q8N4_ANGAN